ncbi:hypothetical protein [Legionella drancourtii]|nr:hypothetical protein [Legionella drancourtii]
MKKRTFSALYGLLWFGCHSAFGLPLDYLMPPIDYEPSKVIHHKKHTLTLADNSGNLSHNKKTELPHKTA